jgi:hypothetical protein
MLIKTKPLNNINCLILLRVKHLEWPFFKFNSDYDGLICNSSRMYYLKDSPPERQVFLKVANNRAMVHDIHCRCLSLKEFNEAITVSEYLSMLK